MTDFLKKPLPENNEGEKLEQNTKEAQIQRSRSEYNI